MEGLTSSLSIFMLLLVREGVLFSCAMVELPPFVLAVVNEEIDTEVNGALAES